MRGSNGQRKTKGRGRPYESVIDTGLIRKTAAASISALVLGCYVRFAETRQRDANG